MKDLLKIMLVLSCVFVSTFIVIKATGLFTLDDIQKLLEQAQQIHSSYLAFIVIGLLFADLFIAIPTKRFFSRRGNWLCNQSHIRLPSAQPYLQGSRKTHGNA